MGLISKRHLIDYCEGQSWLMKIMEQFNPVPEGERRGQELKKDSIKSESTRLRYLSQDIK